MLEILRYKPEFKDKWDDLVLSSRNGTFLFSRDYMDYHSDRFEDCSYLILKRGKVEAVLPGNKMNNRFYSHDGLTYGGLVTSTKIYTQEVINTFDLLNNELERIGIEEIIYKPVPLIYHRYPAQEDIYAMYLNKAQKICCCISSTIFQSNKFRFSELRRRGIKKSIRENVQIAESNDYLVFWEILETNLWNKFKIKPVHSLSEIKLLSERFPGNIKLYIAIHKGIMVAGTVLYIMENIVHVQYISADEIGREIGAVDLLFDKLINEIYQHIPIFDFGISNEEKGNYLNNGLIFQKEGFGGRGIVYEIYKYSL